MRIVVLGDSAQRLEWQSVAANEQVTWIENPNDHSIDSADAIIDLRFDSNPSSLELFRKYKGKIIILNSNLFTIAELHENFVRFNGWSSFLNNPVVEASAAGEEIKLKAAMVFKTMGCEVEWVPDITGFISPRIISSIINEAYFALEEKVSTKEQINTALKLGTAYPYGPFEWSEKIGLRNVAQLLLKLSTEEERYQPSKLLLEEAGME